MKKIILFFALLLSVSFVYAQSQKIEIGMNYGFSNIRAVSDYEAPMEGYAFHTTDGFRFGLFTNFLLKEGLALSTNFNFNQKDLEFSPTYSSDYIQSYKNYELQIGLKTNLIKRKLEIYLRPFIGTEYLQSTNNWNGIIWCGIDPFASYIQPNEIRPFNVTTGLGLGFGYALPHGLTIGFEPEISMQLLSARKPDEYEYIPQKVRFFTNVWSFSISKKI